MSADNGIYVLESLALDGKSSEYRVTHGQAIENLYWWDFHDGDMCFGVEKDEMNPEQIKNYFGKSKILFDRVEALKEADKILLEVGWTEYGIQFLDKYQKIFPE